MTYQSAVLLGYQQLALSGSATGLKLPLGAQQAQGSGCNLLGKLLTVGGTVTGKFAVGQTVVGTGIPDNTTIVAPASLLPNPTTWWLSASCTTENGETVTGYAPSGANLAGVSVSGQAIRWRADGTAPTASVGMPIAAGASEQFADPDLQALSFIQQTGTATLDVYFYQVPDLG